jgi:putative hydrolase of the HAD superfamily
VTATKAVLLDFYGTLAVAVPGSQRPFGELLAARGYDTDLSFTWGDLDIEHPEHSVDEDAYTLFLRARHRRLLERCGVGPDDMEHLLDDLGDWVHGFSVTAYPDARPALDALREKGLRLAICSNWDWDLASFVGQAGLAGLVDVEVTSAQGGYRKPHAEIYAHTLDRLGIDAAEAVFVGDTWDADVEGPAAAGMRAVHIWRDDNHDPEPPPVTDGVRRIRTLTDLVELL